MENIVNMDLNSGPKVIAGVFLGLVISAGILYTSNTKAQAVTTLTGQYGCILNKNFGGATVAYETGTGITGSNFMMYLDFTNPGSQMSVVGWRNWGGASLMQADAALTTGTLSKTSGPLTNSFLVTTTFNSGNDVVKFNVMSVNGGTTLLVQSGMVGSGMGDPLTGVCNKV